MLEYLIQLPCDVLGQNMLGFLELLDIIQLENAAASHKSQQLLREILPYCPPVRIIDSNPSRPFCFNPLTCHWFNKRRCRVELNISLYVLHEVEIQTFVLHDIALCLNQATSFEHLGYLKNPSRLVCLKIKGSQDPAVMDVFFSLLGNGSSVRSLDIEYSNLSLWMEHIEKIGLRLCILTVHGCNTDMTMIKTITEYCPYLEKLSLNSLTSVSDSNVLKNITNNCPHIRSLEINLSYSSSTEADADLTAFAEKCPQLEELSLHCPQLTDQSVIALAQHCSRLKKLKLNGCKLTASALIALSESGLPLEESNIIPMIPIPNAEISAQFSHALSRIRELNTHRYYTISDQLLYAIPYMTGLRKLVLGSSEDHLLVPHLLLLLEGQCCAGLERLTIMVRSSITLQQLRELVAWCPWLHTLTIDDPTHDYDAVLVELARSCPHLQKVTLWSSGVTEECVRTLAAHCRQLRKLDLPNITVIEETVRQLVQHCRRLTELDVHVIKKEGEVMVKQYKYYSSKDIRALRGTLRQRDRESSNAEVIVHNSSNNTCLIL